MQSQSVAPPLAPSDGAGHFAVYSEHSNVLRTWLTAYGIGGPVLILSQDKLWQRLSEAGLLRDVAALFLGGVVLQVALAALNKSVMWACYYGEANQTYKATRRYRFACWLSESYWIDLVCDLAAIALFVAATYKCFHSLVT